MQTQIVAPIQYWIGFITQVKSELEDVFPAAM